MRRLVLFVALASFGCFAATRSQFPDASASDPSTTTDESAPPDDTTTIGTDSGSLQDDGPADPGIAATDGGSTYENACKAFCAKCAACKPDPDFKGKYCIADGPFCMSGCNAMIASILKPDAAGMFAATAETMTCRQFDELFP